MIEFAIWFVLIFFSVYGVMRFLRDLKGHILQNDVRTVTSEIKGWLTIHVTKRKQYESVRRKE